MVDLADLVTGGQIRRITRWGEPVMHAQTTPVSEFDDELHHFIQDMFATMTAAEGVGLAATQVGDNRSLFIFRCPDEDERIITGVMINPTLELPEGKDRTLVPEEEGCLSLPGAFVSLARPDRALCRGLDHNGNPVELVGTGLLARCLQHETDHLFGMVFGDRLSARSRKALYSDHKAKAYRYLEDWPVSAKQAFDPSREDAD
ncbi:MAG: peptide deformylase [Propionibacteriaceae bacterium]|jgi:peptide deformylase|nr:peptide deformylase [Propionibacteriaceae bacterium]